jgi:hypothetical protein
MSGMFNTIGEKVDKVAPTATGDDAATGQEDRVVEEIESLCMNCGENVSDEHRGGLSLSAANEHDAGHDATLPD